jgi:transposase
MKNGLITKTAATKASLTDAKGLKHVRPSGGMIVSDKGYCVKPEQATMKAKGCHSGAIVKENMRPISRDLRRRVITYIESGNSCGSASRKFEVSEISIRIWHRRYKETGSYSAKPYPGKKPRLTESEFINYVTNHPNSTLAQIGSHFKMTARSAHYYMKKFNFAYKKKSPATWKQRPNSETGIFKI